MYIYKDIFTLIEPFVKNKFVFQFIRKDLYKGLRFHNKLFIDAILNGEMEHAKFYLQYNPDAHYDNEELFRQVCKIGDIETAKFLLQFKPDIHINDEFAFQNACKYGHLDMVKWLLQFNPNIRAGEDYAYRAACKKGKLDVARFLQSHLVKLEGVIPEVNQIKAVFTIDTISEAFESAAGNGHTHIMDYIASEDVMYEIRLSFVSAFVLACSKGKMNVIKWFVENKHEFPMRTLFDSEYADAFTIACYNGHLDVAKYLYQQRSDSRFGTDSHFCWTALNGHLNVIQWLLEIDPRFENEIVNAFNYACEYNDSSVAKYFLSLKPKEIIEELKTHNYLLVNVSRIGNLEMLKWLLTITDVGDKVYEMFYYACAEERLEVAKFIHATYPNQIISCGLKSKICTDYGANPIDRILVAISSLGNVELVKFILGLNPNLHYEDDRIFELALTADNLDYIQWMYEIIQPRSSPFEKSFLKILFDVKLDILKWTLTKFTPNQELIDAAFVLACQNGQLQVAKLIHKLHPKIYEKDWTEIINATLENRYQRLVNWLKSLK